LTKKISGTREEVRKFGLLFGVVFAALAVYLRYAGNGRWYWCVVAASGFLGSGYLAYSVLRPIYLGWMKFAFLLAWINTRVILGIFFFLAITPVGFVLRLTGKDLLDEKIDKEAKTYWKKREKAPSDPQRYERMF
jgi:hypothetical protein